MGAVMGVLVGVLVGGMALAASLFMQTLLHKRPNPRINQGVTANRA